MLGEISRTQKDKHWFYSQEVPGGVRTTETGSRWWGQGLGEGTGSQYFMGTEFPFGKMKRFL